MTTFLIITLVYVLSSFIALYKIFEKAGKNPILALIPVYNYVVWMKIIERPWWWVVIMLFPGVNFLMFAVYTYNTSIAFNKRVQFDLFLAAFIPVIALLRLAFSSDAIHVGYPKITKKSASVEWIEALTFAVIAASLLRGYAFEAFTIPTSSMEKDLLIGDYLFVSKLHYGVKIPETPISLPFVHNNLPFSYIPSYLKDVKIPYTRLPKFADIKRFDRVVFNFPTGDTAILGFTPETNELQGHNYYQMVRDQALYLFILENRISQLTQTDYDNYLRNRAGYEQKARINLLENNTYYTGDLRRISTSGYTVRPTDKKENYIKRCVGLPGDVLEIKNGVLWINGALNEVENTQHFYYVSFNRNLYKKEIQFLKQEYNISPGDVQLISESAPSYRINMSASILEKMKQFFNPKNSASKGLELLNHELVISPKDSAVDPRLPIYPNHPSFHWTQDNFGPLWMPAAGATMPLNDSTYILYKRCIQDYEGNTIEKRADGFYINGKKSNSYTFKQGYYYLVGDNRHNSADSRFWGFVPHDHIVGKAVFIWLSLDSELGLFEGKIRWNRLFSVVHD